MSRPAWPRASSARDSVALLVSIVLVTIGILAIWFVKAVIGLSGEGIDIALIAVPLLAFLLISDRVLEVSGPGNVSLKLREAGRSATASVAPQVRHLVAPTPLRKQDDASLFSQLDEFRAAPNTPKVLQFVVGYGAEYSPSEVARYVAGFSTLANADFAILTDPEDKLRGYFPIEQLWKLLVAFDDFPHHDRLHGDPDLWHRIGYRRFVELLNQGGVDGLRNTYQWVARRSLPDSATNAAVLETMNGEQLDALALVDGEGRLRAIVTRDQVLGFMVSALVAQP